MLKNFKVTTKLVAILVAPVLVLIALATVGVRQRLAEASDAKRVQDLTQFAGDSGALFKEIELEGLYAASFSGSSGKNSQAELEQQQVKTDEAIAIWRGAEKSVDPARGSEKVRVAVAQAESRINQLSVQRKTVMGKFGDGSNIATNYEAFATDVSNVITEVANSLDDPQAARGMTSYANLTAIGVPEGALAQAITVAVEVGYYPAVQPKGGLPAARKDTMEAGCGDDASAAKECKLYASAYVNQLKAVEYGEKFKSTASSSQKIIARSEADEVRFEEMVKEAIKSGKTPNDLTKMKAPDFIAAASSRIKKLAGAGNKILLDEGNAESVMAVATAKASEAQTQATLYFFGAIGSILAAALITYSVGRSITVPLRKLTTAAYTLSTERLPALVERLRNPEEESHESLAASLTPIDIHSKDEIGQLADSFNSIQQVTIEVAEEQSVLLRKGIGDIFINLARRNQTLLDRQIEFIDQLEANEEDPDQLDNLFKLDHLATRMRRNAESLLVLAGAEPPRRRGRPVALADVVRVAIGEVEDFARIQLLALDDATVGGNVAVDLAHLLSELMENATHFSPPDTMVEIVGHRSEQGYIISVSDQGIGMSAEQIAESNHQLARPPLVGLALSRSLGFIVIGRLAQRFEITVKLTASPSGGVTALVTLPADLVTYESDEIGGGRAALPSAPPAEPVETNDVLVVDQDLSILDERQPEPVARLAEPEIDDRQFEPVAHYDENISESAEFERGLQQILGDDAQPQQPQTYVAPVAEPPAAPAPKPVPVRQRAAPILTVAEQIAAASRAEAKEADITAAGLVKRTPKKRSDNATGGGMPIMSAPRVTTTTQRSPEEVRKMLSRYRSGLNKGRNSADAENTDS